MIFFEGRCIALIGGAGFIGHNLALEFKGRVNIFEALEVGRALYLQLEFIREAALRLHFLEDMLIATECMFNNTERPVAVKRVV